MAKAKTGDTVVDANTQEPREATRETPTTQPGELTPDGVEVATSVDAPTTSAAPNPGESATTAAFEPEEAETTGFSDVGSDEDLTGFDESPLDDRSGTWQCQNTAKCPDAKTGKTFQGPRQTAVQAANVPVFCPTCESGHVLYVSDNPEEDKDGA